MGVGVVEEEEEEEKWEERADKREAATLALGGAATVGRLQVKGRRGATAEEEAVQAKAGVSLCSCLGASVVRMRTGMRTGARTYAMTPLAGISVPGPAGRAWEAWEAWEGSS